MIDTTERGITEIENDLNIDKDALHYECLDQASRFMKWSARFADAVRSRDGAKRKVAVVRADVSWMIRTNPDHFHIDKVTEGSVATALERDQQVRDAEEDVIDAQYSVNICSAAKEAFEQRKVMIENLIKLYLSGYFSEPKPTSEEVQALVDAGTQAQKENLRREMRERRG